MQIGTGNVIVDVFLGVVAALGTGKGGQLAFRKWGNGRASKYEPITRDDMHELLKPLERDGKEQTELLRNMNTTLEVLKDRGSRFPGE